MTYIEFKEYKPRERAQGIIAIANAIIEEYQAQGLKLTVRQLFYQFVSKDLMANSEAAYNRLINIMSKARMGGLVSWGAIEDRTRSLSSYSSWYTAKDFLKNVSPVYQYPMWKDQDNYVEVWVEKEALAGVIEQACDKWRTPFLACRGYMSLSAIYEAHERFVDAIDNGKQCHLIHLGDHDPSGLDMTEDNKKRIHHLVAGQELDGWSDDTMVTVHRIALNMDQVKEHNPPPNPAKWTDSRADKYIKRHGEYSWELDALNPKVLRGLIQDKTEEFVDIEMWDISLEFEDKEKKALSEIVKGI